MTTVGVTPAQTLPLDSIANRNSCPAQIVIPAEAEIHTPRAKDGFRVTPGMTAVGVTPAQAGVEIHRVAARSRDRFDPLGPAAKAKQLLDQWMLV